MKFDFNVVNRINDTYSVSYILNRERGDIIYPYDYNTSCVAHVDNKPSLRVYVGKGRHSYCFSCGKSYTPYNILRYLTGLSFSELVLYLVNNYGFVLGDSFSFSERALDDKKVSSMVKVFSDNYSSNLSFYLCRALFLDFKNGSNNLGELFGLVQRRGLKCKK